MTDTELWWLTLGLGLVVAVVAWILLHILYRAVKRIDENVSSAWQTATELAANTATTWMLAAAPKAVAELDEELQRHHRFLSGRER
ncbi:MAG: hypothetical protein KY394_05390 [Actinobacteria bacterium]|nr:hypothetical protein [Actinomycetota bacterium]